MTLNTCVLRLARGGLYSFLDAITIALLLVMHGLLILFALMLSALVSFGPEGYVKGFVKVRSSWKAVSVVIRNLYLEDILLGRLTRLMPMPYSVVSMRIDHLSIHIPYSVLWGGSTVLKLLGLEIGLVSQDPHYWNPDLPENCDRFRNDVHKVQSKRIARAHQLWQVIARKMEKLQNMEERTDPHSPQKENAESMQTDSLPWWKKRLNTLMHNFIVEVSCVNLRIFGAQMASVVVGLEHFMLAPSPPLAAPNQAVMRDLKVINFAIYVDPKRTANHHRNPRFQMQSDNIHISASESSSIHPAGAYLLEPVSAKASIKTPPLYGGLIEPQHLAASSEKVVVARLVIEGISVTITPLIVRSLWALWDHYQIYQCWQASARAVDELSLTVLTESDIHNYAKCFCYTGDQTNKEQKKQLRVLEARMDVDDILWMRTTISDYQIPSGGKKIPGVDEKLALIADLHSLIHREMGSYFPSKDDSDHGMVLFQCFDGGFELKRLSLRVMDQPAEPLITLSIMEVKAAITFGSQVNERETHRATGQIRLKRISVRDSRSGLLLDRSPRCEYMFTTEGRKLRDNTLEASIELKDFILVGNLEPWTTVMQLYWDHMAKPTKCVHFRKPPAYLLKKEDHLVYLRNAPTYNPVIMSSFLKKRQSIRAIKVDFCVEAGEAVALAEYSDYSGPALAWSADLYLDIESSLEHEEIKLQCDRIKIASCGLILSDEAIQVQRAAGKGLLEMAGPGPDVELVCRTDGQAASGRHAERTIVVRAKSCSVRFGKEEAGTTMATVKELKSAMKAIPSRPTAANGKEVDLPYPLERLQELVLAADKDQDGLLSLAELTDLLMFLSHRSMTRSEVAVMVDKLASIVDMKDTNLTCDEVLRSLDPNRDPKYFHHYGSLTLRADEYQDEVYNSDLAMRLTEAASLLPPSASLRGFGVPRDPSMFTYQSLISERDWNPGPTDSFSAIAKELTAKYDGSTRQPVSPSYHDGITTQPEEEPGDSPDEAPSMLGSFWEMYLTECGTSPTTLNGQDPFIVQQKLLRLFRSYDFAQTTWNSLIYPRLTLKREKVPWQIARDSKVDGIPGPKSLVEGLGQEPAPRPPKTTTRERRLVQPMKVRTSLSTNLGDLILSFDHAVWRGGQPRLRVELNVLDLAAVLTQWEGKQSNAKERKPFAPDDSLVSSCAFRLSGGYYNSAVTAMEPFLEPYEVRVGVWKEPGTCLQLLVRSKQYLALNCSEAFLDNLRMLKKVFLSRKAELKEMVGNVTKDDLLTIENRCGTAMKLTVRGAKLCEREGRATSSALEVQLSHLEGKQFVIESTDRRTFDGHVLSRAYRKADHEGRGFLQAYQVRQLLLKLARRQDRERGTKKSRADLEVELFECLSAAQLVEATELTLEDLMMVFGSDNRPSMDLVFDGHEPVRGIDITKLRVQAFKVQNCGENGLVRIVTVRAHAAPDESLKIQVLSSLIVRSKSTSKLELLWYNEGQVPLEGGPKLLGNNDEAVVPLFLVDHGYVSVRRLGEQHWSLPVKLETRTEEEADAFLGKVKKNATPDGAITFALRHKLGGHALTMTRRQCLGSGDVYYYELSLLPQLVLENDLPVALEYRVVQLNDEPPPGSSEPTLYLAATNEGLEAEEYPILWDSNEDLKMLAPSPQKDKGKSHGRKKHMLEELFRTENGEGRAGVISSGFQAEVSGLDMQRDAFLRIRLLKEHDVAAEATHDIVATEWSRTVWVPLANKRGSFDLSRTKLKLGSGVHLFIEPAWNSFSPPRLTIVAPFWILNKTNLFLKYSTRGFHSSDSENGRSFDQDFVPLMMAPQKQASLSLLPENHRWRHRSREIWLSCYEPLASADMSLKTNPSWSSSVDISKVGASGAIDCPGCLVIGYTTKAAPAQYSKTRIVILQPRFIFENKTELDLQILATSGLDREGHGQSKGRLYDIPRQKNAILYDFEGEAGREKALSLRRVSGQEETKWSEQISIEKEKERYIWCDGLMGRGPLLSLRVVPEGATIHIIVRDTTGTPPFQIQNRTGYPLTYRQADLPEASEVQLGQYQYASFAWEAVGAKSDNDLQIEFTFPGTEPMRVNPSRIQCLSALQLKGKAAKIYPEVFVDKNTRVIAFRCLPMTHLELEGRGKGLLQQGDVDINLPGITLTLIDPTPHEYLTIYIEGLRLQSPPETGENLISVHHVEIDDMTADSELPLIFAPKDSGFRSDANAQWRPETGEVPFLTVKLDREPVRNSLVTVEVAQVALGDILFKVDLDYWLKLLSIMKKITPDSNARGKQTRGQQACLKLVKAKPCVGKVSSNPKTVIYLDKMVIEAFQLDLVFLSDAEVNEDALKQYLPETIANMVQGIRTLSPTLGFDKIEYRSRFFTPSELAMNIGWKYAYDVLDQWYKIILSLGLLGDPIGLYRDMKSGVERFVRKSRREARGSSTTPGQGAKILLNTAVGAPSKAVGKAASGLAGMLQAVTFFDNKEREEPPEHIGQGIVQGGKLLTRSIAHGAKKAVQYPVQGMKQEGVTGAIKGSAKGVLAGTAGPVVGVLGATGTLAKSIGNSLQLLNDKRHEPPRRPPRSFSGDNKVLKPLIESDVVTKLEVFIAKATLLTEEKCSLRARIYLVEPVQGGPAKVVEHYHTRKVRSVHDFVWNELFTFEIRSTEADIAIELYDEKRLHSKRLLGTYYQSTQDIVAQHSDSGITTMTEDLEERTAAAAVSRVHATPLGKTKTRGFSAQVVKENTLESITHERAHRELPSLGQRIIEEDEPWWQNEDDFRGREYLERPTSPLPESHEIGSLEVDLGLKLGRLRGDEAVATGEAVATYLEHRRDDVNEYPLYGPEGHDQVGNIYLGFMHLKDLRR